MRGSRGRGGRATAALMLVGAMSLAVTAAGCEMLLSGAGFGTGFEPDGFPSSSPIATFKSGSATIAVDGGAPIELTDLEAGSGIESLFGSDVHWSNADGGHLHLAGAGAELPDEMGPGPGAFLTLDRIQGGDHWTTLDPTRCIVDVTTADASGISGHATCKGLEWYDETGGVGIAAPEDAGQPKFDAEITFEAKP